MAYRLVLEVPESVAFEMNTVINSVPDAQVLVTRNSHGLGFNDPYLDYSIAAHSLALIERVYRWMLDYGQPWPEVRLVMHDGRRVSLPKANASLIIAAIRRDQPWVDHTMPQIGVHEPKPWLETGSRGLAAQTFPIELDDPESLARRIASAPRVPVHNLAPAEQFYDEVMDLHVVGRAVRRDDGALRAIEGHYDPKLARLRAEEADVVFLENGPLQINLERTSRGLPLPYGTDPIHLHTTATREQMSAIKGRLLMFNINLLESDDDALRFVDPFNVVWTVTPHVTVNDATPAALQG